MIKSLHIQNLQSHKDSLLIFEEGVNVLTGASDGGKSTVLKALKLITQNRPVGENFISHWADEMVLSLQMVDGVEITRKKGKDNTYSLTIPGKEKMLFKAFGQNVPEEISSVLNLKSINVQSQLSPPFLLTESPGFVADHFNKVARIDKINYTEKNINGTIRSINSDISKLEKDIEKYNQELDEFPDLEKIEIELDVLERLEQERNKLSKDKNELTNLACHIDVINERIEEESILLSFEKEVGDLLSQIELRDKIDRDCFSLSNLREDIEMITLKIDQLNQKVQLEKKVSIILTVIQERKVITTDLRALNSLKDKIYSLDRNLVKTQENLIRMETWFKKKMGAVCILCGSKLK